MEPLNATAWRGLALIVATALISALFFQVARPFLVALLMAALAAEMANPARVRLLRLTGGRDRLATVLTLVLVVCLVIVPLFVLGYMAALQAAGLVGSLRGIAMQLSATPMQEVLPDWLPREEWIEERLSDWWPTILQKLGELGTAAATYFVGLMSSITRGAARLFLDLFIFLYALYFFLGRRTPILEQLLAFTGLRPETQARLSERAVSITRATLRGTVTIAAIQGLLGGLGFWVIGIGGVAFWTVVMMVTAMIPAIGASTVIVIAAVFQLLNGHVIAGLALAAWGMFFVGSVDNVLRPWLVGRDAQLDEILILVSTLGGLGFFGIPGVVIGPVLAGLFITIWSTLREVMDETAEQAAEARAPGAEAEAGAATAPAPAEVKGGAQI